MVDSSAPTSVIGKMFGVPRFLAKVTTGDRLGAGTKSAVYMQLVDSTGKVSQKTSLDKTFIDDHKRGATHSYTVSCKNIDNPDEIAYIILWRDRTPVADDSWLLDRIELEDTKLKRTRIYPMQRWIGVEKHYHLYEFDAFLPQQAMQPEARKEELAFKRRLYEYKKTIVNGPQQVSVLPDDEKFSEHYLFDIVTLKGKLLVSQKYREFTSGKWETLEDISNIYVDGSQMGKPESIKHWKDDRWFGLQRVEGVNSVLITLCKEIPTKLGVKATDVEPFLEGLNLNDALSKNKIFIIDLEVLKGIPCQKQFTQLVAPICLLYLNKKNDLMPIAIQLFQDPSPKNPVFFPSDPKNVWLLAKMFYNMGDAQQHQSLTHLGNTHLLMETIVVAANRHLSPSHPMFRLLAPHFLYLLAIDARGIDLLISPGGWVDAVMAVGRDGMFELIGKNFQKWDMSIHGNVEKQIEKRGVLDPKVLPYYPYRDDAVSLYKIIRKYITSVVKFFYDTPEKLAGDFEVQNWVKEMGMPQSEGGCGILSIPMKLDTVEQLVEICTTIASTCSLQHAAANFQQYEAYGYLPNFPATLMKMPPDNKREITEKEMMEYLPSKSTTLDTMVITKILSTKPTQSLGDFEVQYLYNPKVVLIADEFRLELKKLSQEIKERNDKREFKYDWLDPQFVPNSISV